MTDRQRPATLKDVIWHQLLGRPYRLHLVDHGGSGPTIVMLHGVASSSANWDSLIPLIKQDYRCVTIDLIGFGKSPKPQWYEYTMDQHLTAIHVALRKLHLKTPFTLAGHSLGSLISTRYARMYGRQVNRLVLLSPPVYAPLYTIKNRGARGRTALYLKAYKFLRSNPRITAENITKLSRFVPQIRFMTLNKLTWIPFIRSLEHCIESQTMIDDIAHVSAPVDIFYGLFDEVIVPYNIRQLAGIREVSLYPLRVNHVVGKRYAAAVAKVLKQPDSDEIVMKMTTA